MCMFLTEIAPQLIPTVLACLNAISDGMLYTWTAPEIPIIRNNQNSTFKITLIDEMGLEAIYILAGLFGLPFTILLVDRIGRKPVILLAASTGLLAWILIGIASHVVFIYVARFIAGMGSDIAFVVIPMYVTEISQPKYRGALTGFSFLFLLIGIVIMYSIGPITPLYVPPIIGTSIIVIHLCSFSFMPESPYFLMMRKNKIKAGLALDRLRKNEDNQEELSEIGDGIEIELRERKSWKDLFFIRSNRRAIFIVFSLLFLQQFTGITFILLNFHTILKNVDTVHLSTYFTGVIYSSLNVTAAIICMLLVDKFGRKLLLFVSSLFSTVFLLTLTVYFYLKENTDTNLIEVGWVPILGIMFFSVVFKIGLGFLPQTISAELFPNNVRALGMAASDGFYIIVAAFSILLYGSVGFNYGLFILFLLFSIISLTAGVFVILYVPETNGKTLNEIQIMLQGNFTTWGMH